MLIGYMRPSEEDLNCEKQWETLHKLNCEDFFTEAHTSAKNRKQLKYMLDTLQPGDKVIVVKLASLADSSRHLMELLRVFKEKSVTLHTIKEDIDTSRGDGYSLNDVVKFLVDFQSDIISERTKRGLRQAEEKGITVGRPRKPDKNVQHAILMYESRKYSLAEIRQATGISKSTLYRYLES